MTLNKKNFFFCSLALGMAALGWKFFCQGTAPMVSLSKEINGANDFDIPGAQTTAVGPKVSLSELTAHQIQVLEQIFESKNDNDPRMDSELKELTSEAKNALKEKYTSLPENQRNARGTIVFLIGRNLTGPADYQFLKQVLSEPPCLGLVDCAQPMSAQSSGGHEDTGGIGVVLDYPQMAALKAIEKHPAQNELLKSFQGEALQAGRAFRSVKVSEAAEVIARKLR